MKLLVMTEDGLSELCALCDIPEMGLVPLSEVSARLTEVDNDYLLDKVDSYWQKYGGTTREVDYATRFCEYLLAHMEVK